MTNTKGRGCTVSEFWCILRCFTVSPWGVTWRLSTRILLRGNPGLMTTKAGRRRASKHSHSLLFFAHTQTQRFDILTSTTSPKEIMPGNYWKLKVFTFNPLDFSFKKLDFFVISLFFFRDIILSELINFRLFKSFETT